MLDVELIAKEQLKVKKMAILKGLEVEQRLTGS